MLMHRGHQTQSILAKPIRSQLFDISQLKGITGNFLFRNKPLDQYGVSILSVDFSLLQFTLYQYILRYRVYVGSKSQRNPLPKHVELQTISTYSNQWPTNKNRCWSAHFSANFKIRQKLKNNTKADIPINKLFEEKLFDHQFHQSQNLLLTEEAFCISASAEDWVLKERYTKENTSSSLHIQWAIDQGATRLGGL